MFKGRSAALAAQKPYELLPPLPLFEGADAGIRPAVLLLLFDEKLPIRKRRDLREVGDRDDLRVLCNGDELLRDDARRLAADARVDLVKDVGADASHGRELRLDRQHESAHLAAADDLAQLLDGLARIGGKEKADTVQPLGIGTGKVGFSVRLKGDLETRGGNIERPELLDDASSAKVYACSVIGINRGTRGKAGELKGLFLGDAPIARAEHFCGTGLFGTFEKSYDLSGCETAELAPVSEATIGKAVIWSTVDGSTPKKYDIAIAKVEANDRDNKNFVIKVTDEELIEATGGIVQGMSGSPILQNGKLIGAVTHVFLNDPTRGYGISIERMMAGGRACE